MPHSFDLSVRVNQEQQETLHVEISDQDWEILEGYLDDFDRLAASRVGAGIQVKTKFTFDAQGGFAWSREMPPDDDVALFLHRLRPFLLKDERSNFNRVCNVLGRCIVHPGFAALLRRQRDEFAGRVFQSQIQFLSNDTLVNSEQVLQDWLNAYEYHRDPERRDQLAKIHHDRLPLEATRPLFVSMLIDKARAVAAVAAVIRLIVTGEKGRELRFDKLSVKRSEQKLKDT
jgi:hypothetical protein